MRLTKEQLKALDSPLQKSIDDMHYVCALGEGDKDENHSNR